MKKHSLLRSSLALFILLVFTTINTALGQNLHFDKTKALPQAESSFSPCPFEAGAGPDRYFCNQDQVVLQLFGIVVKNNNDLFSSPNSFHWEGFTVPPNNATPSVTVHETTTFKFIVWSFDSLINLITNPTFEDGNVGFTSGLKHSPGDLTLSDRYDVLGKLPDANPAYPNCEDHTPDGFLMLATSSSKVDQVIWAQSIPVEPNTEYFFSGWATRLQFKGAIRYGINGTMLTRIPPGGCNWGYFGMTWNSGSNLIANLSIEQVGSVFSLNANAIDDLYFGPLCKSEDEMTVYMTEVEAIAEPAPSLHHCEDFEITLSGEGSSVGPDITYQWSTPDGNIVSGENTLHPVVNAPGTYTLVVTLNDPNFQNCTATATTVVLEAPSQLSAWITAPVNLNCAIKQITLNGGSTPGGNFTYQWTATNGGNIVAGANAKNAQVNASGTYTLLVTDNATGCTAEAERQVVADTILPKADANANAITCVRFDSDLNGLGSSKGTDFRHAWTTSDGNILSGQDSIIALAGTVGTYILKVTNIVNQCIRYDTVVVAYDNIPPVAEIAPPADVSCILPLVPLVATEDTSNTNLTYTWTTSPGGNIVSGENTPMPTVNAPGWYFLSIVNPKNGCTDTDSVLVDADTDAIIAIANAPNAITCTNTAVLLNANGSTNDPALTYIWTTADGNIVSGADSPTPMVNQPGTYQLWLSNPENGCTATDIALVGQNTEQPLVSVSAAPIFTCTNTQQFLQAQNASTSGTFTYQWTASNGGNFVGGQTTLQPEIDAPGTYTLLAANTENGCTASTEITVGEDVTAPDLGIAAPNPLTCVVSTVVLQGQNTAPAGTYTYQWTATNGGNITSGANTLQPEVNAAGTYTLVATNSANGCTDAAQIQVTSDGQAPTAGLSVAGNLDCNLTPVNLTGSSNIDPAMLNHTWTAPDGSTTSTGTNPMLPANQPGTYVLTLTNTQNGCTATAAATVAQNDPVEADLNGQTDATCFGASDGSLSVSASGGTGAFGYQWSSGANTPMASNLPAGTFTVVVTDAAGCSTSISGTIGEPTSVAPNASSTAPTFFGGSDGTASAQPTGGTPPYSYDWTGGSTNQTIAGLPAGDYTVTVTDANGCTAVQTVNVFGGACNLAAGTATTDVACHGDATGTATATPQGGTAPFAYLWSTAATGQTASDLAAGTYLVVVTDANGCQFTASATVGQPELLSLDPVGTTDASCPNTPDGTATVLSTGGTGTVSVSWSNGEQGPSAMALLAGQHTATATDQNGCEAELTVTISASDTEAPVVSGGPVTLPLGPAGVISLTLQNLGATVTDNCELDEEEIVPPNFDCMQLGTHTVTVTAYDAAGNSSSLSMQVTIIDNLAPEVSCPTNIQQCADNRTVQYLAPVATDNCLMLGGNFDLVEGLPSGSQFPVGTTTTTYTFTDKSGNVGSCSFNVTILTPITVGLDELAHDVGSKGIGKILVSPSGSQGMYTYEWKRDGQTVATTEDLLGVGAGTYTLIVTDAAGCTTVAGPYVVDDLVGTDTPDWADLVAVYPNPTTGVLYVSLPADVLGSDLQLLVYDVTGRLVAEQKGAARKLTTLDWSAFADGLYTLLVRTESGQAAYQVALGR
ncbi:MAG: HYR domain-containing protein [Saprospiraceae bacterium]